MLRRVLSVCAVVLVAGCGSDNGSPTGPSNQNPAPQPQANRNPVIASVQVAPTFGISELTVFNFSSTASDADNDALSYSWSILGGTFAGSNQQIRFGGSGGTVRATVNVNDGKGGTAASGVDFIIGSATGRWTVVAGPLEGTSFDLTQYAGGIVAGTFDFPGLPAGRTDPAEPGIINAAGQLNMRVKIDRFLDFYVNGTMDTTGRMITGTLKDSGFTGQPFVMVK